jgi:YbbR domain-containing protein
VSALARHWELKVLALVFAVVFWLFINTSERVDMIAPALVEIDGLAPGLTIAGEQPESVDVQLHGARGSLARLGPDQLKVRVSVAGAGPGEVVLAIRPEHIAVPPGITVTRVNPSRVRLVLTASAAPPGERVTRGPRS